MRTSTPPEISPDDSLRGIPEELIIEEARRRHRRRLLTIAVAVAVVAAVVAVTVSVEDQGSSPKAASSARSTDSHKSTPVVLSACGNGQIKVVSLGGGAGAGNVDQVFGFVNTSARACTISGYPKVVALNADGTKASVALRQLHGLGGPPPDVAAPPTVTIKPGHEALATVSGSDIPAGDTSTSCAVNYPKFLVTPPAATRSKVVTAVDGIGPGSFPGCVPLRVDPVVPETASDLPTSPQ